MANPPYIEQTVIQMPRHHMSIEEVVRLTTSYLERRSRIHPKYEATHRFSIVVFADNDDGAYIGNRIASQCPAYFSFDVHAMYRENAEEPEVARDFPVSPAEIIAQADILVELGVHHPNLPALMRSPNRLHLRVEYVPLPVGHGVEDA